jgi:putative ABC transport system permease protein
MSGDPIPHKSARLLVPVLDNASSQGYVPGAPPADNQMSYIDARNLLAGGFGSKRTALYGTVGVIEREGKEQGVIEADGIATGGDFFSMFEVPMLYGSAWSPAEDKQGQNVIVLSREMSEKVFGQGSSVGKSLRIFNNEFKVVGVVGDWAPMPRYPHLINGSGGNFAGTEDFFIPFNNAVRLEVGNSGHMTCTSSNGAGFQGLLASECTWIQYWVELQSASERRALQDYLASYQQEQTRLGRFQRHNPPQVFNVMEWMDYLHVVKNDSKLQVWLAFGFLLLCLVNTVGLLLAKFSVRAGEVGVRRAMGATRLEIFKQFLVETGVLGLAGGLLGIVLSFAMLFLAGLQSGEMKVLAHLDASMLLAAFGLALVASLLAGLLPTWRACQVTPALQLKSQ